MNENAQSSNEITIGLTALATGGACVGTVEAPEELRGKKGFVPYGIPGELVTAQIVKQKKNFLFADLKDVKRSSPHRIAPPCAYFAACGGCDLQHIELAHQRELKRSMIEESLRIQGGLSAQHGVTLLKEDLAGFAYRRRMSFHMNREGMFGLYRKSRRQIVEIEHCMISTDTINACLRDRLGLIKGCAPEAETVTLEDHDGVIFIMFEVHPRSDAAVASLVEKEAFKELVRIVGNVQINFRSRPAFKHSVEGKDTPPIGHFSQNNAAANSAMIDYILGAVPTDEVTDLYAGAGNISLPLALAEHHVTAVEVDPSLAAYGKRRAEEAGVTDRLQFEIRSCEKWIESGNPAKTVVLDPPRGGAFEVAKRLSPGISPYIVYVSCYPPTFERDAQELVQRGYILERVNVLDMFPQTYHAELIGIFRSAQA